MINAMVATMMAVAISACPAPQHEEPSISFEATYYNGGSGIEGGPNDCFGEPLSEG